MNDWNESGASDVAVGGKKAPTATSDSSRFIIAWTNDYSPVEIPVAVNFEQAARQESFPRLRKQAVFDSVTSSGFAALSTNDRCETSK